MYKFYSLKTWCKNLKTVFFVYKNFVNRTIVKIQNSNLINSYSHLHICSLYNNTNYSTAVLVLCLYYLRRIPSRVEQRVLTSESVASDRWTARQTQRELELANSDAAYRC